MSRGPIEDPRDIEPRWAKLLLERDPKQKLREAQINAIMLLARGLSVRHVAEQLDEYEATIIAWRRNHAFEQALEEASAELFQESLDRAKRLVARAIEAESEALDALDAKGRPLWRVRIMAAKQILARQPAFAPKTSEEDTLLTMPAVEFRQKLEAAREVLDVEIQQVKALPVGEN